MIKISNIRLKINYQGEVKRAIAESIAGLVDYTRVMLNFV